MTGVEINGRNYWIEPPIEKRGPYYYDIKSDFMDWALNGWEQRLNKSIEDNRQKFQEWLDYRVYHVLHSDHEPMPFLQLFRDTGQMMIDATYINGIRGLEF